MSTENLVFKKLSQVFLDMKSVKDKILETDQTWKGIELFCQDVEKMASNESLILTNIKV